MAESQQRVGKICTKVLRVIKEKGMTNVNPDELISEMTQIELELCRDYLALKTEYDMETIAGTPNYIIGAGIFKIKQIVLPTTWKHPFHITFDAKLWARYVNAHYHTTQPIHGYIWNGILRMIPVPPLDGDDLYIFAYALPTQQLVYEEDPEIGAEWDDCLKDELLYRFAKDQEAHARYLSNASKLASQDYKEAVQGDNLIEYSARELGF
jgi:hypothetical protein